MKQFRYLAILFFTAASTHTQASWQDIYQSWQNNWQKRVATADTRLHALKTMDAKAQKNNQAQNIHFHQRINFHVIRDFNNGICAELTKVLRELKKK